MYPHPFSVGYWRTAANELKDVRKLTFAALCIALCMALAAIPSVPLWGGAKITWGFLARAVCAWVCGPVLGVVFAVAEDLLSFFITGGGGCQEYFNMMMIADTAKCEKDGGTLAKELENLGKEIGVVIHCQHEDIFNMMHRV